MKSKDWKNSRVCSQCGIDKTFDRFYKKPTGLYGYSSYCKECYKKYDIVRCEVKRTQRNKKAREYYKKNTDKHKDISILQMIRDPLKSWCRQTTRNAITTGKIKKCPCLICNTTKDICAHHENYNDPFNIMWLCRRHHMELHRKYKKKNIINLLKQYRYEYKGKAIE